MAGKGRGRRPRKTEGQVAKRATFPWINSQIITVSEAGELQLLITTVEAYLPMMNLVNLATALHRLAKMATNDPKAQVVLPHNPVVQALQASARAAVERAGLNGSPPSAQALSNIAWSIATLQLVDRPLLEVIAVPAVTYMDRFKPFELSTILWAFAKVATMDAAMLPCAEPLFEAAAAYIPDHTEEFTFRCLATTVWAFASARQPCANLFRSLTPHLLAMISAASSQELANAAWAFSTVDVHNERLFTELAKRANARLHEFKAQELSNMLWAFAANNFFHAAFFTNAAAAARRMELSAQHLANILWALTRMRPRHPSVRAAVLALLPECKRQLELFKPQEISSVALAAAKVFRQADERPHPRGAAHAWEQAAELTAMPTQVIEFFAVTAPWVQQRLPSFSGQSLANIAMSFLAVRAASAGALLAAVGREVTGRIEGLEPTVLLYLIKAFALDLEGLAPPAPGCWGPAVEPLRSYRRVTRALFLEAARRVDYLAPRELQILSRLCGRLWGLHRRSQLTPAELRSCCASFAEYGVDGTMADAAAAQAVLWPSRMGEAPPAGAGAGNGNAWGAHAATVAEPMSGPDGDAEDELVPLGGGDGRASVAAGGAGPGQMPELPWACSVKNTFLHVKCDSGSEDGSDLEGYEDLDPGSGDRGVPRRSCELGPPLHFLPKYIDLSELQAWRVHYQAFRSGQAAGAKGEIGSICPSSREQEAASALAAGDLDLGAKHRLVAAAAC